MSKIKTLMAVVALTLCGGAWAERTLSWQDTTSGCTTETIVFRGITLDELKGMPVGGQIGGLADDYIADTPHAVVLPSSHDESDGYYLQFQVVDDNRVKWATVKFVESTDAGEVVIKATQVANTSSVYNTGYTDSNSAHAHEMIGTRMDKGESYVAGSQDPVRYPVTKIYVVPTLAATITADVTDWATIAWDDGATWPTDGCAEAVFSVAEGSSFTVNATAAIKINAVKVVGGGKITLGANVQAVVAKAADGGTLVVNNNDNAKIVRACDAGTVTVAPTLARRIEVDKGGVYDVGCTSEGSIYQNMYLYLNGGLFANNGTAGTGTGKVQFQNMKILADSQIGGSQRFCFIAGSYNKQNIHLNGHELRKTGSCEYIMRTANFVGGGRFDIGDGTLKLYDPKIDAAGDTVTAVVRSGGTLMLGSADNKGGPSFTGNFDIVNFGTVTRENWSGSIVVHNLENHRATLNGDFTVKGLYDQAEPSVYTGTLTVTPTTTFRFPSDSTSMTITCGRLVLADGMESTVNNIQAYVGSSSKLVNLTYDTSAKTVSYELVRDAGDVYWCRSTNFEWEAGTPGEFCTIDDQGVKHSTQILDEDVIVIAPDKAGVSTENGKCYLGPGFAGRKVRVDEDVSFCYYGQTHNIPAGMNIEISANKTLTLEGGYGNAPGSIIKESVMIVGSGTLKISGKPATVEGFLTCYAPIISTESAARLVLKRGVYARLLKPISLVGGLEFAEGAGIILSGSSDSIVYGVKGAGTIQKYGTSALYLGKGKDSSFGGFSISGRAVIDVYSGNLGFGRATDVDGSKLGDCTLNFHDGSASAYGWGAFDGTVVLNAQKDVTYSGNSANRTQGAGRLIKRGSGTLTWNSHIDIPVKVEEGALDKTNTSFSMGSDSSVELAGLTATMKVPTSLAWANVSTPLDGKMIGSSTSGSILTYEVVDEHFKATVTTAEGETLNYTSVADAIAAAPAGATVNALESDIVSGAVSLTHDLVISVADEATVTIPGVISGSGKLTKSGAGTLILLGANTFTGGVQADEGVVQLSATATGYDLVLNGGVLKASVDNAHSKLLKSLTLEKDSSFGTATDKCGVVGLGTGSQGASTLNLKGHTLEIWSSNNVYFETTTASSAGTIHLHSGNLLTHCAALDLTGSKVIVDAGATIEVDGTTSVTVSELEYNGNESKGGTNGITVLGKLSGTGTIKYLTLSGAVEVRGGVTVSTTLTTTAGSAKLMEGSATLTVPAGFSADNAIVSGLADKCVVRNGRIFSLAAAVPFRKNEIHSTMNVIGGLTTQGGKDWVKVGDTLSFTATADTGYEIKVVIVGNDRVDPVDGVYSVTATAGVSEIFVTVVAEAAATAGVSQNALHQPVITFDNATPSASYTVDVHLADGTTHQYTGTTTAQGGASVTVTDAIAANTAYTYEINVTNPGTAEVVTTHGSFYSGSSAAWFQADPSQDPALVNSAAGTTLTLAEGGAAYQLDGNARFEIDDKTPVANKVGVVEQTVTFTSAIEVADLPLPTSTELENASGAITLAQDGSTFVWKCLESGAWRTMSGLGDSLLPTELPATYKLRFEYDAAAKTVAYFVDGNLLGQGSSSEAATMNGVSFIGTGSLAKLVGTVETKTTTATVAPVTPEGLSKSVTVDPSFVIAVAGSGVKDPAAIQAAITAEVADRTDGLKVWQAYAMGLEAEEAKTAMFVVSGKDTGDAATLKIVDGLTPRVESGVAVVRTVKMGDTPDALSSHALGDGESSDAEGVTIKLPSEGPKAKYIRFEYTFE